MYIRKHGSLFLEIFHFLRIPRNDQLKENAPIRQLKGTLPKHYASQNMNHGTSSLSYMTGFEENGDGSCLNIGHVSDKLSGELSPDDSSTNTGPEAGWTLITILKRITKETMHWITEKNEVRRVIKTGNCFGGGSDGMWVDGVKVRC